MHALKSHSRMVPIWAVLMACLLGCAYADLSRDLDAVYRKNPFAFLSRDYFARLSRDPCAVASTDEITIGTDWSILVGADTDPLVGVMAGDLAAFLKQRMGVDVTVRKETDAEAARTHTIVLTDHGGGDPSTAGSYTIDVGRDAVAVRGQNAAGLRDGVVQLVDRMGFRAAPILQIGEETLCPRLALRMGTIPRMGTWYF